PRSRRAASRRRARQWRALHRRSPLTARRTISNRYTESSPRLEPNATYGQLERRRSRSPMPMPKRRVSLLAVEVDGYSPPGLQRARTGIHATITVAKQPSEPAATFAARLVERIDRARAEGSVIVRASLACNGRSDVEAIAARILVVRTILAQNPDLCDSDVSMTSSHPNPALRHQFEAIRQTFREHGPRNVFAEERLEAALGSRPLHRTAF